MAIYTDTRKSFTESGKKLISRQILSSDTALLIYLALIKFLAHLVTSGNYGFSRVYHSLPQDEQAQACFFTENYGEAGAIDLYGPQYHLPQAISGHNTYYLWGPGTCTGEVVISIGYPFDKFQTAFDSVTQAAMITCKYCMPEENNLPVFVCLHLKTSMQPSGRPSNITTRPVETTSQGKCASEFYTEDRAASTNHAKRWS